MKKPFMIPLLLFFSLIILTTQTQAGGFGSPNSKLGPGLISYPVSAAMWGLGGAGLAFQSPQFFSPFNPSQWVYSDFTHIHTTFSYSALTQQSDSRQNFFGNINFEELVFTFPVTKQGALGIGLSPFSVMNYSIYDTQETQGQSLDLEYFGTGGLTRIAIGGAYKVSEVTSIGGTLNYYFGSINQNQKVTYNENNISSITTNSNELSGLGITITAMTTLQENILNLNDKLVATAILDLPTNLNGFYYSRESSDFISDTTELKQNQSLSLPLEFKTGFGYQPNANINIAVDFIYKNTSSIKYDVNNKDSFADSWMVRSGIAYVPELSIGTRYWRQIEYKTGLFFGQSNVQINNKKTDELGLTAGLGLPLPGLKTNLELTATVGWKGYLYDSPLKDTLIQLNVGLNFKELWFQKRIID